MALQPNTLFHNRYLLIETIGRGSFGEVWRARDEVTDLYVAIKIYIAMDESGLQVFRQEFKTVHNLHHPNLLKPEHYDIYDNRPYLVMPLCKGSVESLSGQMEERELWNLINCVSKGLEYLHGKDILHRDIKPDNILVTDSDEYLISDFGVSKKLRNTMRRNSTRQKKETDEENDSEVSGTIPYMAPELFSKNPNAVKATDIWAFGITLFELMTGELLFAGQGGILQIKGAEIPDLPNKYSRNLRELVLFCLQYETWDRPTAGQIADFSDSIIKGYATSPPWEKKGIRRVLSFSKLALITLVSIISVAVVFIVIRHYWHTPTIVTDSPTNTTVILDSLQQEQSQIIEEDTVDDDNGSSSIQSSTLNVNDGAANNHQDPASTIQGNGVLQLAYGKWYGGIINGKPDGKGVLTIHRRHSFYGTQAEAGYRLEGTYDNGELVIGKLFDGSDNLIKTIMP